MSNEKSQSAIREVRDQLFMDTADGSRLGIVSDNLGWFRPVFGFGNDDEWRALSRKLALGPKQVEWAFRQVLSICFGPDYHRRAVMAEANSVGDLVVAVEDASNLVQVGTLVFSPGTVNEETVEYCFVDYATNQVYLERALVSVHPVLDDATNYLESSVVPSGTTLTLMDTSDFPTTGYPYPILIGRNTQSAEVVTVSDNNTSTNVLTVSSLTNGHDGMRSGYLRKVLNASTFIGRTFLEFDLQDTAEFPEEGWVRIDTGGGNEEIVFYDENDVTNNILFLKTPLTSNHSAGESVELLKTGATVETASVVQNPVRWFIYDTSPNEVKVCVPEELDVMRLIDASFLHDPVPSILGSTTLAVATLATDTQLELASVANFPDEAGMLTINGSVRRFYTLRDEAASPNPILQLTEAIGAIYPIGTTVDLFEIPYAGTLLEEGNNRNVGGVLQADRYPGPYSFDPGERSIGTVSTTLNSIHPPATEVMLDTLVARETLEAKSLSLWPNTGQVRVGSGTGFLEDLNYTDITLRVSTIGSTVSSGGASGTSTIVVDVTGAAEPLPETVAASTANYRIIIDEGGGNEEIVTVIDESLSMGLQTLTIAGTFSITHAAAETVMLLNDVITIDATGKEHRSAKVSPTVKGHAIEYLTDTITLATTVGFDQTGGEVIINLGYGRHNAESRYVSENMAGDQWTLEDTSDFPTSDFPYQVILSPGRVEEEVANVIANDTGTNTLTFSAVPLYTHTTGPSPFTSYVVFNTGGQELIEYQDVDGSDLILNPPQVLQQHTIGESVIKSGVDSISRTDGFSYPFYLPPNNLICVETLLERVRAAGIEVRIVTY